MIRLLLILVPFALVGCKTQSDLYCETHPGVCSADDGGGRACTAECTGATPVCNTDKGMCTQCFAKDPKNYCTILTPHCDVDTCTACVDDTDCPNSVCMLDGSCADPSNIIHASATGAVTQCGTSDAPCTLSVALLSVTPSKNIVKLDDPAPAVYSQLGSFLVAKDVTIDARNAILQRTDGGPILTISMPAPPRSVTLLGGTIQSATSTTGNGILCNSTTTSLNVDGTTFVTTDSAIQSMDCALKLTRLKIHDNPARAIEIKNGSITLARSLVNSNHAGGLHVDSAKFVIVGNVFMSNGDSNSPHPAIEIQAGSDNNNRLDFNTIAFSSAQDMTVSGVSCTSSGLIGRNNIIWMNSGIPQVSGNCKYKYSDIGPDMVPTSNDVSNNTNGDPKLAGPTDPHIAPDGAAHGTGDSTSPLEDVALKDIDNQPRVVPVDIGADQYYPPGKP